MRLYCIHSTFILNPNFPGSFGAFSSFLRSEFSEENIEFWKECKDYRERTPLADLPSKAAEIWLAFLHPLAPREVGPRSHASQSTMHHTP